MWGTKKSLLILFYLITTLIRVFSQSTFITTIIKEWEQGRGGLILSWGRAILSGGILTQCLFKATVHCHWRHHYGIPHHSDKIGTSPVSVFAINFFLSTVHIPQCDLFAVCMSDDCWCLCKCVLFANFCTHTHTHTNTHTHNLLSTTKIKCWHERLMLILS